MLQPPPVFFQTPLWEIPELALPANRARLGSRALDLGVVVSMDMDRPLIISINSSQCERGRGTDRHPPSFR